MKNQTEDIKFFNRQAKIYDQTRGHINKFAKKWIKEIGVEKGQSVLALGCGTGKNFEIFNESLLGTGKIVGVDFSPEMIEIAHYRIKTKNLINATAVCDDANRFLEKLDQQFDVIVFAFSLFAIPDHEFTLNTAWNQLKPGGSIVIADFKSSDHFLFKLLNPIWVKWSRKFRGDFSVRPWEKLINLAKESEFKEYSLGFKYFFKAIKPC